MPESLPAFSFTSTISPETGAKTSETLFTDSTTIAALPCSTTFPFCGSSAKTMSVRECCAKSVMPTMPMLPSTFIHSWSLVYFNPSKTLLSDTTSPFFRSIFLVKRYFNGFRRAEPVPYLNLELQAFHRELFRHVSQADVFFQRRRKGAGCDNADFFFFILAVD